MMGEIGNFLRKNSLFLSVIILLLLIVIYWCYWHFKPFTANAFVFADTRAVSPLVEGFITEIRVKNNQVVRKGELLFVVFQEPYKLKIEELKSEIKRLNFEIKTNETEIKIVEAEVKKIEAELANNIYLSNQAKSLLKSNAVSAAYAEEKLRAEEVSRAELSAKSHAIDVLNLRIKSIQAQIEKTQSALSLAEVWLDLTEVRALSDGYITNLTTTEGGYYHPGEVIFGFVDCENWYVQANFEESELSQIKVGTKAKIWLRQYPDRVFNGVIEEINWGVERRQMSQITGISEVKNENEWFQLPQRFPVQIKISDSQNMQFTLGGSAYVELDIPSHPIRQFFWELFLK